MHIGRERKFSIYAGRDFASGSRFAMAVGFGFRDDAEPGEIVWRHWWKLVPRMPVVIRRALDGWIVEYGFGFNRRCRLFRW